MVACDHGQPCFEDETARWVGGLDSTMADKLAAVGLVKPREPAAITTVAGFLVEYVARRVDVKPATREVWRQVNANLLECFGGATRLADNRRNGGRRFQAVPAKDEIIIDHNCQAAAIRPAVFQGGGQAETDSEQPVCRRGGQGDGKTDRQRFVTREETGRLLEACPNTDWRVIVALCRFGGLRCPSEVLALRWQEVDWERQRVRVRSPKTEHHAGKASREMPLFPELAAMLAEAFDVAPEGAVYVVADNGYRQAADTPSGWRNCNMRTQFGRIIERAGLEPWPRLFHAMRASRETELAAEYPVHVVTAWLGNTPRIAMKHYLMTTEADFQKAAGSAAQNPAHLGDDSGTEMRRSNRRRDSARRPARNDISPCESRAYATICNGLPEPAKIISGEDRIRTCGPVSRSPV